MPAPPRGIRIEPPNEEDRDMKLVSGMKEKLHEYRMAKIRENLEGERKKAWIYVGNSFRDPPPSTSSSSPSSSKP
ncbi:unnamed protein product [Caenorhabditis sp. 36 PRJEB53466]|nr:unnamed protein product [Caenorhabditis sp. 36 PRJEB53466]